MGMISFNFTKMDIEKKKAVTGKVNIGNNVVIKEVSEKDISFAKDQKGIQFNFEFTSKYEPDYGYINLNGEVLYLEEKARAKEIIDDWKKNKRVEKELMANVLNNVLMKCNIQALILSQSINMPPPIPLPKVNVDMENPEPVQKKK